jgi:hypothetical protein
MPLIALGSCIFFSFLVHMGVRRVGGHGYSALANIFLMQTRKVFFYVEDFRLVELLLVDLPGLLNFDFRHSVCLNLLILLINSWDLQSVAKRETKTISRRKN